MSDLFNYSVVTPEQTYLDGEASMVVVPGIEGDIGFLANHVSFISSIRPGFISIKLENGDDKEVYISEGFVQFSENNLLVIAVELIEKQDLSDDFVNKKIADLESILSSADNNIKVQSKIDSLKALSL